MSEKKVSGKVLMFTGIVIIVFLVAIFGFIFWEPVPEMIQGEAVSYTHLTLPTT